MLIAIGGHIGDAVIVTSAIRALRDARPDVEIALLLPSWSAVAVSGHPDVARMHHVDHWHSNRSGGIVGRIGRYVATRRRALRELREACYDVAVDLYPYFPNHGLLLAQAGIPVRLGYTSAGFAPTYTRALPWADDERHMAERHAQMLRAAFPDVDAERWHSYDLPAASAETTARVERVLHEAALERGGYTVLHPGTGSPMKEWPEAHWRQLAALLVERGHMLVFTGQGASERAMVQRITEGLPHCADFTDALSWAEFVEVVRAAAGVITVDTVAGHVAAAVGTPCTTIWIGPASPAHWRPLSEHNTIVTHSVLSVPDTAVREVSVDEVLATVAVPHRHVVGA